MMSLTKQPIERIQVIKTVVLGGRSSQLIVGICGAEWQELVAERGCGWTRALAIHEISHDMTQLRFPAEEIVTI